MGLFQTFGISNKCFSSLGVLNNRIQLYVFRFAFLLEFLSAVDFFMLKCSNYNGRTDVLTVYLSPLLDKINRTRVMRHTKIQNTRSLEEVTVLLLTKRRRIQRVNISNYLV